MSARFDFPDLDSQPVLSPAQKSVLTHVQRSEYEQRMLMRRFYADRAYARARANVPAKPHRVVRTPETAAH